MKRFFWIVAILGFGLGTACGGREHAETSDSMGRGGRGGDAGAPDAIPDMRADAPMVTDEQNEITDAGSVEMETASAIVPQCMGRQPGYKFCIGSTVYECDPSFSSMTMVVKCVTPKPTCMGGACEACQQNAVRLCSEEGLMGRCAAGMETCGPDGTWGLCSIQPAMSDTCDRDNDNSCNGKRNENCACINGETGKCGEKLGAMGTCANGATTCANGQWGVCDTAAKPIDMCIFGNDDMCTGVPIGSPRNTQCQCGFPMPNPASSALPNATSYTDNGDNTVTDKITGFRWERVVNGSSFTQAAAIKYCSDKGPDWRLPNRLELAALVDFTIPFPAAPINPAFPNTPITSFWTSSVYAGVPNQGWIVTFFNGSTESLSYDLVTKSYLARCVLGAPKCYASRYNVKTGGEVYDSTTGLTWQQSVDPNRHTWAGASAYCSGLSGGWRLPSLTELQTIVDETRSSPSIDPQVFPGTPSDIFWTSSQFAGTADQAWTVYFTDGSTTFNIATNGYQTRCVR